MEQGNCAQVTEAQIFMIMSFFGNGFEKMKIALIGGRVLDCGVVSALHRVITALQKAIREHLAHYYITAFCMVHGRRDRKVVLCRP